MTFWERPIPVTDPTVKTPEQAAMLALLDQMQELEKLTQIERSIRIAFEIEVMERLAALDKRIKALERRA
jgi:hypothetical protein